MTAAPARDQPIAAPRQLWWAFLPFTAVSAVHIGARFAGADDLAAPTKLLLMPLLAAAVLWSARNSSRGPATALLLAALLFSWLGDGAGTFFPFAPELPVMLGSFGLAHIFYIWLLTRYAAVRPLPRWALVFPVWWLLMLLTLWPSLGSLAFAVAAYGVVLAGTAAAAARSLPMVAAGGLLFLSSDTILALRIFLPDAMPPWTSAAVMLTYCAGQGLIVAGVLRSPQLRRRRAPRPAGSSVQ